MTGPILILPLASGVFLAKNERGLSAEGSSPGEALARLNETTERWLEEYRRAVITPPVAPPPVWAGWTGTMAPDDPVTKEWEAAIAEYRAARDAEDAVTR